MHMTPFVLISCIASSSSPYENPDVAASSPYMTASGPDVALKDPGFHFDRIPFLVDAVETLAEHMDPEALACPCEYLDCLAPGVASDLVLCAPEKYRLFLCLFKFLDNKGIVDRFMAECGNEIGCNGNVLLDILNINIYNLIAMPQYNGRIPTRASIYDPFNSLESICLSNIPLRYIPAKELSCFASLSELELNNISLSVGFESLAVIRNLRMLSIDSNGVVVFPDLSEFKKLIYFSANSNQFGDLDFHGCLPCTVECLFISDSCIFSVENIFSVFPNLKLIYFLDNPYNDDKSWVDVAMGRGVSVIDDYEQLDVPECHECHTTPCQ